MESGVLEAGLNSRGCMPPPNMSSWPTFIASLEIGLDIFKSRKSLEKLVGAHRDIIGDIEKFYDCLQEEKQRIEKFYRDPKNEKPTSYSNEIYSDIKYLDVLIKLMDCTETKWGRDWETKKIKGDVEVEYCRLIFNLESATGIILGKERGRIEDYTQPFEDVIAYFKANPHNKRLDYGGII